ncbi:MAG: hypothetical protein ACOXZT_00185 [Tissierellaceae bacterium]|jgi:hypothetical protein
MRRRIEWKNYLVIFLLIFVSVSPLISNNIRVSIISILIITHIKYLLKFTLDKKFIVLIFILSLFLIASMLDLLNINDTKYSVLNIYFPACFILGYALSKKYELTSYLRYIDNIVFISALFSIMGMIVIIFFPHLLRYLPSYTYGGFTHKTAYLFNVLYADGLLITRNAGFAREPGIYQMLLNLGMLSTITEERKRQIIRIIIYGIAIYLTKSTSGLIIYGFLVLKIIKDIPKARPLIFLTGILFLEQIYNTIIYQKTYKLIGSKSFDIRKVPMINAYRHGINHFFGIGNTGYDAVYSIYDIGSWDSYSQIFIRYGYLMLGLIFYISFHMMRKSLGLSIIIILTSLSQNIWYLVMITPIYFMCLDESPNSRKVRV